MAATPLNGLSLEDLLPHRGGMLLVDEVLEVESSHARTSSSPRPSWPLAEESGVHPLILVELAAQTAGVCNGWDRIQTQGLDSNQMGWLVGIKKAEFFVDSLPFAQKVVSCARTTHNFANLREVACELYQEQRLIARVTLQLFQAEQS
ncbi:hypothetical protein [Desulfogranum mediterraneum]|uniref:hypothetical protein n=1 Tax=Desulfogranum mediterraneum TaxID=160661 RepID=UPI0003FE8CDE|nr:hypothetical protein [Desulfogranum mediterraneum]